jgi:hypothetical protein
VPASDKAECLTLMDQFGRQLLEAILNDIPFGSICSGLNLCTNAGKIKGGITECQVCQIVMQVRSCTPSLRGSGPVASSPEAAQDVDQALEEPSIQNEIVSEMESVCTDLGPLSGLCKTLLQVSCRVVRHGPGLTLPFVAYRNTPPRSSTTSPRSSTRTRSATRSTRARKSVAFCGMFVFVFVFFYRCCLPAKKGGGTTPVPKYITYAFILRVARYWRLLVARVGDARAYRTCCRKPTCQQVVCQTPVHLPNYRRSGPTQWLTAEMSARGSPVPGWTGWYGGGPCSGVNVLSASPCDRGGSVSSRAATSSSVSHKPAFPGRPR